MPLLDFKEIPYQDEKGRGLDTFEKFARDFLEDFGLKIVEGPDRGADAGRDLIVKETRKGILESDDFRWLVSCKHNAHANTSVYKSDETDIRDRVNSHSCKGFIGFYSTTPSSSLIDRLKEFDFKFSIFDNERIEKELRRSENGLKLIERYFPQSFKNIITENPTPSNIFKKKLELNCDVCGDNLFEKDNGGVLALGEKEEVIEDIYLACKGKCDRQKEHEFMERGLFDMWFELADFKIPLTFFHQFMILTNSFKNDYKFSETAEKKLKELFLISFQQISRDQTEKEQKRVDRIIDREKLLESFGL